MPITQNRKILLIVNNPGRMEGLSLVLQETGYKVLIARDGREGFRLTRRESPDLVISEMNLPVISGLDLCRMIRADRELWTTPLIFLSEVQQNENNLIEILRAGADDCLTDTSNPHYLMTKIEWLIERKYSENHLIDYYQNLRCRQLQLTQIIKGALESFTLPHPGYKIDSFNEINPRDFEKNLNKRIDLGFSMVSAVFYLLEEHVKAFESWGRLRGREDFTVHQDFNPEHSLANYEYITYDLIDDELPAN